jgi:putative membrane protein
MAAFIVHLLLTAVLLLVVARVVRGVEIKSFGSALIGALVLGLVNALVRPIMVLLTLPLTILTFGLFLLVINALMFGLAAALVPGIRVRGFLPALFGSVLLTVLNLLIEFAIPGI